MPAYFPRGMIVIWHGSVATIPSGYVLCDGDNGTPDLRDQFILGAGDGFAPGATGGSADHDHTVTTFGHTHTIPAGGAFGSAGAFDNVTGETAPDGITNEKSNLPPYHALCYIMRV